MNNFKQDFSDLWGRAHGRYLRTVNSLFFRRPLRFENKIPYISFTFDDFPRSALQTGGKILTEYGLKATYYASFGLMGKISSVGKIFQQDDISFLLSQEHELGCHTFDHCHSYKTKPGKFEKSIIKNRETLNQLFPQFSFRTFSFPISAPRPRIKWITGKYFDCCRYGGQTFNLDIIDLSYLKAYFLEMSPDGLNDIRKTIDKNNEVKGWLIFATHDISDSHSPFGCKPSFFEKVVDYASKSGAVILPVVKVLDRIIS